MPNDSAFGDVECELKRQQRLYLPEDILKVMTDCRKKNKFIVTRMQRLEFKGTAKLEQSIVNRKVDINGQVVSWLKTREIALRKDNPTCLHMSSDLNDQTTQTVFIGKGKQGIVNQKFTDTFHQELNALYLLPKPIAPAKLSDIRSLMDLIPPDSKPFYESLVSSNEVTDDLEMFGVPPDFDIDGEDILVNKQHEESSSRENVCRKVRSKTKCKKQQMSSKNKRSKMLSSKQLSEDTDGLSIGSDSESAVGQSLTMTAQSVSESTDTIKVHSKTKRSIGTRRNNASCCIAMDLPVLQPGGTVQHFDRIDYLATNKTSQKNSSTRSKTASNSIELAVPLLQSGDKHQASNNNGKLPIKSNSHTTSRTRSKTTSNNFAFELPVAQPASKRRVSDRINRVSAVSEAASCGQTSCHETSCTIRCAMGNLRKLQDVSLTADYENNLQETRTNQENANGNQIPTKRRRRTLGPLRTIN